MTKRRGAIFKQMSDNSERIRRDVANPALRHLARCEGSPVGVVGNCLLCEADQGVTSPFCVREEK